GRVSALEHEQAAAVAAPAAAAPVSAAAPAAATSSTLAAPAAAATPTDRDAVAGATKRQTKATAGAPVAKAAAPAVAVGCTTQGPPVVIGQVGAFSGLVGANNQGALNVLPAWVRDVNLRGGLGCHPVTLYQKDTASDPARSEAAVKEMVQQRNAVALVANYAPLDVQGFRKGVEGMNIAAVGGDQVTPDWHLSPDLFPVGGIERAQFAGSVQALAKQGVKKIGIFYCVESTACTAFRDTLDKDGYAKKFGMEVAYQTQISLTQNDFTSACQAAKGAGVQALVFAGDAGGVSRTARSCATVGLTVPIAITASQAGFDPADKNLQNATLSMAAPVFPFSQGADLLGEKLFRAAMDRYAPTVRIEASSALAWSCATMLERVVNLLGPSVHNVPLTRALIFKGLGLVKKETLGGLIPPTTYTAGQPHASENFCYAPMAFDKRGFYAPQGTTFNCI
ncbi:MAG TPA: ABC transporter substrate-binding protein, partial [Sporichthyaceae bacterium]|nr:ABC transporter substrate-binding protein [Sporichthyaceae bacterium]